MRDLVVVLAFVTFFAAIAATVSYVSFGKAQAFKAELYAECIKEHTKYYCMKEHGSNGYQNLKGNNYDN